MAPPKSALKPAPRPLLTVPDLEDFERLGCKALKSLPEPLRAQTRDVLIIVEDFPDDDVTEMMNLDTPYDLLGLYQGVALPERSIADVGRLPDCIHLYRRPILDYWCESGERLDAIIHHVLLHEIGHHFGFSDEEMEELEEEEE
jgi:predicted Zn-dependent protease with MMP-like domain